ncbi:MAG: hypothetical protein LBJ11_08840 [Oscillospiraceae bacterium]|jgi:hypothetical protein|nr:hypothetical protein [Oscillospiraceae bacterium]
MSSVCHWVVRGTKLALCWLLSAASLLLPLGRWLPEKSGADELFNRYVLRYTAQVRLKGEISYSVGSRKTTETFFLEAAEEPAEFASFIDGFLEGRLGRAAGELTLSPLEGEGSYQVKEWTLSRVRPPKNSQLLLEDAFCRVGINLAWGGAVDAFVWKGAPTGFTNLLNRADPGRLLQQAYYGTEEPPYAQGDWGGERPWPYNPVQGGDMDGNGSKLVDYTVQDKRIRIKCRPADWAKHGELTPSYMENTYTLDDGLLTVDNRFVDFSGYTHPARHQEMPACYVVTALDTFRFYDGPAPWTGGALTEKTDLPFWDGGNPACYFPLDPANTETWCAWTMGTGPDAFGLSVYTPGAELLIGGVFSGVGGEKITFDPNAGATGYMGVVRTLQMSAEPFEYTYYLTAGPLSQIRGRWLAIQ